MKVKGLPNVDGPRTPHILLHVALPMNSTPLAKIDICTNENLYYLDHANASFVSSFSF